LNLLFKKIIRFLPWGPRGFVNCFHFYHVIS
jgi:hypothetical protein